MSPTLVSRIEIFFIIGASILSMGERSEPHTCGENGKLSVYIYIIN